MARVAQYKALGSKLGGYRKTLSDVGTKEYAKKHADWKAAEEKGLYSQIGGSVANIIGIASEVSQLKQLKGYGEAAKQLSGVGERDVEYQPLGSFGEAIGLDPKTRKEHFFGDTGQALSTRELQNIGYIESLGMETKYSQSKYAERPEVPIATEEPEDLPMEVLDPLYESQTKTIGTYDPGLELESMEGLPSLMGGMTGAATAGQRGAQSMVIGEEAAAGQETKGYQPWLPEGVEPEFAGMIEKERDEPTPFGHVARKKLKETFTPVGTLPRKIDESPLKVGSIASGEGRTATGIWGNPSGAVFESIKDVSLGDLETSIKSSPIEQAMLSKFEKSGATQEKINQITNIIGTLESQNQNIAQSGGGPGRGLYQFETGEGQGFETALNRIKRMYTEKKHLGKDKYPSWIDKAMKHGDATKLTPAQQKELLIADLYMKAGSDEKLIGAFSEGNIKDLWLDMHWAGKAEDRPSKSAYYDSVMAGVK